MSTTNPKIVETEWDELQRQFGNLPPKAKDVTEEECTKQLVDKLENVDPLEGRNLQDLDELEDEVDEAVLDRYRKRRIEELKKRQKYERFGEVVHIAKDEFVREVTEASKFRVLEEPSGESCSPSAAPLSGIALSAKLGTWVVVHLYQDAVTSCRQLNGILPSVAKTYKFVKFVKAISTDAIENYPNTRLPTVLLYYGGSCQRQIIGPGEWGGDKMTARTVRKALRKFGVIPQCENESDDSDSASTGRYCASRPHGDDDSESDEERNRVRSKGYASTRLDSLVGGRF